jgi:diguanylate cyclase (GGDEF)-like protein
MDERKVILVVDDNQLNCTILCRILASDGYDTKIAENGQIAFDMLNDHDARISLVLLDIGMPVMDGYTLLSKMQAEGMLRTVPVIIMTGSDNEDAEIKCLEMGASDFLRKPYNAELVLHRVRSLLRLVDNAALINRLETDQLTGAYSQKYFNIHAETIIQEHPDDDYRIVYTDVDDFKMINARYGMNVGDELLKYLAGVFRSKVEPDGICGRINADNFILLIKDDHDHPGSTGELNHNDYKNAPVKGIQLKCGIYPVTDRSLPVADMCDRAKLAVDAVKHQYGLRYAVYNKSMMDKVMREHRLSDSMEESLEKGQFVVYLQPKHSAETGAIAGAEALVRWNHPELGFVSPGDFIPLFERNGFITKLDAYMWRQVCILLKNWIAEGHKPVPVSVNASRIDFTSADLPDRICKMVDSYGIPHDIFHFEVTESAYTNNPQQMITAVSALRDRNFKIEMDDFGSGYSSLNMLSELPIDYLKLDMRFMNSSRDKIQNGKRDIMSFVISLSKWLQLPTIAEGVETKEDFELLRSMGCNYIQGYYFAKPMPVKEFEAYLLEHQSADIERLKAEKEKKEKTADTRNVPTVMLIEDDTAERTSLKTVLSSNYHTALCPAGRDAFDWLLDHREEIACIILDLMSPAADGFHVLEMMSANDMIHEIPIIAISESGSERELRALQSGVYSVVSKPYKAEIIRQYVARAVEERQFWERKHNFEKKSGSLYQKAYHDELTGLLNRYGLNKAREKMAPDEKYVAVVLDIDNLKEINDGAGFVVGDEAIKTVARTLIKETRKEDAVARLGGDEFIVLLHSSDDVKAAETKSKDLIRKLKQGMIWNTGIYPSCSVGITVGSTDEKFKDVILRGDAALHQAKHMSKGTCCIWNESMKQYITECSLDEE